MGFQSTLTRATAFTLACAKGCTVSVLVKFTSTDHGHASTFQRAVATYVIIGRSAYIRVSSNVCPDSELEGTSMVYIHACVCIWARYISLRVPCMVLVAFCGGITINNLLYSYGAYIRTYACLV